MIIIAGNTLIGDNTPEQEGEGGGDNRESIYEEGGYEPSVSFVSPRTEDLYRGEIEALLLGKA